MATLFELTASEQHLLDMADGMDPELLEDTLASLQAETDDKLVGYIKVAEEADVKAMGLADKAKSYADRAKSYKTTAARLRATARGAMEATGRKVIETEDVVIKLKRKAPSISVFSENEVPSKYYIEKVTRTISKTLIKNDIKAGVEVPGAAMVQGYRLEDK